jgi:TetR/AcrR family transcriptional regulator, fatty acid metabolism regulator protein
MKLKTTDMVEAAGKIIHDSGVGALSLELLAKEMKIKRSTLNSYFQNDDDILMLLLISLENELKKLITDNRTGSGIPGNELQLLFESIHKLLEINPYYLSIIFPPELQKKNAAFKKKLLSIRIFVRTYLLEIIDQGKKDQVFKNQLPTISLGNYILKSFRLFINEQHQLTKMAIELERLKTLHNSENRSST